MTKIVGSFKTTVYITDDMVDNILCTALEGGSNYWIDKCVANFWPEGAEHVSDGVSRGGKIVFFVEDDDDEYTLTLDDMLNGIEKAYDHRQSSSGFSFKDWYENHDADDADLALQYALFGEIVYG